MPWYLPPVLIILTGVAGFWLLLSKRGRDILGRIEYRIRNGDTTKAPHEKWPEILNWRIGDSFDDLGMAAPHTMGTLRFIGQDGYACLEFCGDKFWMHISILTDRNQSLQNRCIDAEIKNNSEYMDLLAEFNKAVDELKARDRRNGIAA